MHWRASARAGQLLVREYVDPVQPQCTVVLDDRAAAVLGGGGGLFGQGFPRTSGVSRLFF